MRETPPLDLSKRRIRPHSPNIQIYRPQLTSVLSIGYRVSGVALSIYAVGLVIWLLAAAAGPEAYSRASGLIESWPGQILLFFGTFALFWHLCGGLRHLLWDAGYGYELRSIYMSGWAVAVASVVLTALAWAISLAIGG